MKIYFLVEGKRTEFKVYPKWLSILIPELQRINHPTEFTSNSYYIFNGDGYPSLLDNHLTNSIEEVNTIDGIDYLCVILDADDDNIQEKSEEIIRFMSHHKLELNEAKLEIIVQKKCIESWFLGNKDIFKSNPADPILSEYVKFYNVSSLDPEEMPKQHNFNSIGQFHYDYCKRFLKERNIRYSKKSPNEVVEEYYLNKLIQRSNDTSDLKSLSNFINFCKEIKDCL